jgi:hypothetical protein
MASRSWSCSRLASHSLCASDSLLSSELRTPLEMDGRESTSSLSVDGALSEMTKDSETDIDEGIEEDMFFSNKVDGRKGLLSYSVDGEVAKVGCGS